MVNKPARVTENTLSSIGIIITNIFDIIFYTNVIPYHAMLLITNI